VTGTCRGLTTDQLARTPPPPTGTRRVDSRRWTRALGKGSASAGQGRLRKQARALELPNDLLLAPARPLSTTKAPAQASLRAIPSTGSRATYVSSRPPTSPTRTAGHQQAPCCSIRWSGRDGAKHCSYRARPLTTTDSAGLGQLLPLLLLFACCPPAPTPIPDQDRSLSAVPTAAAAAEARHREGDRPAEPPRLTTPAKEPCSPLSIISSGAPRSGARVSVRPAFSPSRSLLPLFTFDQEALRPQLSPLPLALRLAFSSSGSVRPFCPAQLRVQGALQPRPEASRPPAAGASPPSTQARIS
jgi:hypothetical protein